MFVELGTSCLTGDSEHFGSLQHDTLRLASYAVAFFERDAWKCGYIDCERSFIKTGQEAASESEEAQQRGNKKRSRGA